LRSLGSLLELDVIFRPFRDITIITAAALRFILLCFFFLLGFFSLFEESRRGGFGCLAVAFCFFLSYIVLMYGGKKGGGDQGFIGSLTVQKPDDKLTARAVLSSCRVYV